MKSRTTIFLIAAIAIIVAYVGLRKAGWFTPADPQTGPIGLRKIFPLAPSGARQLTIESAGGRRVVFEKINGRWNLVSPVSARVDEYRVNRITDMLLDMVYQRLVGPDDADATVELTGLDAPRWTVTLTDLKDVDYTVCVGRNLPEIGMSLKRAYVRSGSETYVVQEDFAAQLDRTVSDFRDRRVFDLDFGSDAGSIVGVEVIGAENYRLAGRSGRWEVVKPVSANTDHPSAGAFAEKLESLRVTEFVADEPDSLVPYGLDKPVLIVRVNVESPEPASAATSAPATRPTKEYTLALGRTVSEGSEVFAHLVGETAVFKLSGSLVKDLQPRLIDLRDRGVLAVDAEEVSRIELDTQAGAAVLTEKLGRWEIASPAAGSGWAAGDAVRKIIEGINSLKADDFLDDPDAARLHGLDPPLGTITLVLADEDETVSLLIGARSPSGNMVFVKSGDCDSVAVVNWPDVKALLVDPVSLWRPVLLELAEREKVTQLVIRRGDRQPTRLAIGDGGLWQLETPIKASADRDSVNRILDKLDRLTAARIVAVAPQTPRRYARADKQIVLDITTKTLSPPAETVPETAEKTYSLHVANVDVRAYAWLERQEVTVVGEFASGLYDDLTAEVRDRTVWSIGPDEINNIKIIAAATPLELRREGERWIYASDRHVRIDGEKVGEFLESISELRAERFVAYESADLAKFALNEPWLTLELTDGYGEVKRIIVSSAGAHETSNRFAVVSGLDGVFLLSADNVSKLAKLPGDFKK